MNKQYLVKQSQKAILKWLEVILRERFGLEFKLSYTPEYNLVLNLVGHDKSIVFNKLLSVFHESHSNFSCGSWCPKSEGYNSVLEMKLPAPGISDDNYPLIEKSKTGYTIGYDILGLTYWMLSRLEEVGRNDLDTHQRFPACSSHAYKHGYLERPIIDEWLDILGQVMLRCWPRMKIQNHHFKINPSHDVDMPSQYGFLNIKQMFKYMASHAINRGDIREAASVAYYKIFTRSKILDGDPFNTFDFLMSESEKRGLKSAFYFMAGSTNPLYDAQYDIFDPRIKILLREINERGHEIGLHPSYETYINKELFLQEYECLRRVCDEQGVKQSKWGGRMHYLRWSHPLTMRYWNDSGITYDSTLGYADRPGFRCGTCFEYPAFDVVENKVLDMRIRPLHIMECSIIDKKYLGLGLGREASDKINAIKSRCQKLSGYFNILWHNSSFVDPAARMLYLKAIS